VQDEVNQEESEQDEVDGMKKRADSTSKVTHIKKNLGAESLCVKLEFNT